MRAPLAGRVARADERELVLAADGLDVRLAGLVPTVGAGAAVAAGELVGHLAGRRAPAHLHVQAGGLGLGASRAWPRRLAGRLARALPAPAPLLGLAVAGAARRRRPASPAARR